MPGLPEPGIARVRRSCQQRVPGHDRDRGRVECNAGPRHLTIVEYRPPWRQGTGSEWTRFPVTRLATPGHQDPALYRRDRHLRFHLCDKLRPSPGIGGLLLREIDRDPIAIFRG